MSTWRREGVPVLHLRLPRRRPPAVLFPRPVRAARYRLHRPVLPDPVLLHPHLHYPVPAVVVPCLRRLLRPVCHLRVRVQVLPCRRVPPQAPAAYPVRVLHPAVNRRLRLQAVYRRRHPAVACQARPVLLPRLQVPVVPPCRLHRRLHRRLLRRPAHH